MIGDLLDGQQPVGQAARLESLIRLMGPIAPHLAAVIQLDEANISGHPEDQD